MSINELESKIQTLQELEALSAEVSTEIESIKAGIKAEMLKRNTEELTAGRFIVRWTFVLSNRFDSTAFKKGHARSIQKLCQADYKPLLHH